jgi:hypothetical protein
MGAGLQEDPGSLDHVLVDYPVPFRGGTKTLKAINWPKGFYLGYDKDPKRAKAALLTLLGTMRSIPAGSESKYVHAIEFYDHCAATTFVKASK